MLYSISDYLFTYVGSSSVPHKVVIKECNGSQPNDTPIPVNSIYVPSSASGSALELGITSQDELEITLEQIPALWGKEIIGTSFASEIRMWRRRDCTTMWFIGTEDLRPCGSRIIRLYDLSKTTLRLCHDSTNQLEIYRNNDDYEEMILD